MATSTSLLISLAGVTLVFFLNMSAYMCLEGLQSSINPGAGTYSLSVAYSTVVITSLFLPTIVMDFMKHTTAIGVATLGYAVYSAANCYPNPYLLIAASVVLGCSGAVIWATGRVYVSNLATYYASLKGVDKDKTVSHFFGIFLAFLSSSLLVLNGVSSLVLQATKKDQKDQPYSNATGENATARPVNDRRYCGVHKCDDVIAEYDKNSTDVTVSPIEYDKTAAYILFGAFALTQVLSALVAIFALSDPSAEEDRKISKKDSGDEHISMTTPEESDKEERVEIKHTKAASTAERIKKHAISTGSFIIFNHVGQAMIPITMHCGILQAFSFGQFTRYWVACYLGVEYIGFSISACGIGSIIGAYGGGFLTKFLPRWVIMVANLAIEVALCVALLVWEPDEDTESWVFFVLFGIVGLVYSAQKTLTATIYSLFFATQNEPANAALSLWDMMGTAVAYALSFVICNTTYVIGMLTVSVIGTVLYLFAERNYSTKHNRDG